MTDAEEIAGRLIALMGFARAEDHAYGAWERAHRLNIPNGDQQLWTAVRVEIQRAMIGA